MLRRVATAVAALLFLSAGFAAAKPGTQSPNGKEGNSEATITGTFDDECRDFEADSSKDISYVVLYYSDGREAKIEKIDSPHFSIDGDEGDELDQVEVKSGTTVEYFDCPGGALPECSDDVDNADPEDSLADEDDPGCWTDPEDPTTYDPDDDDETDEAEPTECSDDVDNADPEDTLADEDDPGCWTDPEDPTTYDPDDDDETDEEDGAALSCRASAVRFEPITELQPLLGETIEPVVANDPEFPCNSEDSGLINEAPAPLNGQKLAIGEDSFVQVAFAQTDFAGEPTAHAGVAHVVLSGGTEETTIDVRILRSEATGDCTDGSSLEGESTVVSINGNKVEDSLGEAITELNAALAPLGVHIDVNTQEKEGDVLTQRALVVTTSLGTLIVGETIVDCHPAD